MQRLSSCYFCGTALDASLDEYPVVPDALRPATGEGSEQTVVLCDTCARKLDAVMETVVGATEPPSRQSRQGSRAAGTADETTDDGTSDIESTLGDDEELLRPVGDDDTDDEDMDPAEAAEASGMQFGDDRTSTEDRAEEETEADGVAGDDGDDDGDTGDADEKPKYSSSRGAGFRREDDDTTRRSSLRSSDDETKYTDSRGAGYRRSGDQSKRGTTNGTSVSDDSDEDEDEDESATDSGSSRSGDESRSADQASGGGSGGETQDSEGAAEGGEDDGGADTPDVSMTRLENTKVMRLLENREFPVDKEEFVTVAASAYQISQRDCEKVLDLAVEHGLIRERDGQLYAGEL